jgi:hypothetical protein
MCLASLVLSVRASHGFFVGSFHAITFSMTNIILPLLLTLWYCSNDLGLIHTITSSTYLLSPAVYLTGALIAAEKGPHEPEANIFSCCCQVT